MVIETNNRWQECIFYNYLFKFRYVRKTKYYLAFYYILLQQVTMRYQKFMFYFFSKP